MNRDIANRVSPVWGRVIWVLLCLAGSWCTALFAKADSGSSSRLELSPLLLDDPLRAVAIHQKKLGTLDPVPATAEAMKAAFELQAALIQLGRYEEAIRSIERSLPTAKAQNILEAEGWFRLQRYQAQSALSGTYTAEGFAELDTIQSLAQQLDSPLILANVHLQKAYFHTKNSQDEWAAKSFYEAYKIVQNSTDDLQRYRLLGSLAIVYTVNNSVRIDRAIEIFEELHVYLSKNPYRFFGSVTYFYYGDALSQLKQWDKALEAYQRSFEFADKIQDEIGRVYARLNIAKVNNQLGRHRVALAILAEIQPTFRQYQDGGALLEIDLNRAKALLKLGEKDEALAIIDRITPAMEKIESPNDSLEFHRLRAEIDAAHQRFDRAYLHLNNAFQLQGKIFDERRVNIAQRYYADYEMENRADKNRLLQQENEIQALDLSNKRRQTQFILAILFLILGVLFLTFWLFYRMKRKNDEIRSLHQYIESNVLQRFLPPVLVAEIIEGRSRLEQKAKAELVTILFADLCEFTQSTERLGTSTISHILNDFFVAMTEVVFEHGGTIDKFIGDCVMVIFGAPLSLSPEEQARKAVACAFAMHRRLEILNRAWEFTEHEHFEMRIGIHQGTAVVGSFGGPKRADYTVIGQTVNLASRVEALADPRTVLVTQAIAQHLPAASCRSRGHHRIRGLNEERELFEVLVDVEVSQTDVA